MSRNTLPRRFFTPLGYRKDGRPIFPIAGGSEPPKQDQPPADQPKQDAQTGQQQSGTQAPEEARDEHGAGLGFPKDTRVEDMNADQKANYWRNQSKVQQKKAEEAERRLAAQQNNGNSSGGSNGGGSGTVPNQQQGSGNSNTGQADAAVAIRSEAAQDAALATIRSSLALRGKKAEDIDELVDLLSPAKFVTADHKVDTAKVVAFIEKNAPAGNNGGGGGSDFGAGRREGTAPDRKAAARAEAEKRFAGQKDQPNRGSLGGLRR